MATKIKWTGGTDFASTAEKFTDADGTVLNVHGPQTCADEHSCVIHKPSKHVMFLFPLVFAPAEALPYKVLQRRCPHGNLHLDPDGFAYHYGAQGQTEWYTALKTHQKECECHCCQYGGKQDTSLVYSEAIYTLTAPVIYPTPQEFPLSDVLMPWVENIATEFREAWNAVWYANWGETPKFQIPFTHKVPRKYYLPNGMKTGVGTSEFYLHLPTVDSDSHAPVFQHYRSGVALAWDSFMLDGSATISRKMTKAQFKKQVWEPVVSHLDKVIDHKEFT